MSERDALYLRIPLANGAEEIVGPIDASQIQTALRCYWQRARAGVKGGRRGFSQVQGMTVFDPHQVDLAELKAIADDLIGQGKEALAQYGVADGTAGREVRETVYDVLTLKELFEKIEAGLSSDAEEILQKMLYALMSATCRFAESLQKTIKEASLAEGAIETLAVSEGLHQQLYHDWVAAIRELLQAVEDLHRLETEILEPAIVAINASYGQTADRWTAELPNPDELTATLEAALMLCMLAERGQAPDDFDGQRKEWQTSLATCRRVEAELVTAWEKTRLSQQTIILEWLPRYEQFLAALTRARQRIIEVKQELGPQAPSPAQHRGERVSAGEVRRSEELMRDLAGWSTQAVVNRCGLRWQAIERFCEPTAKPQLPLKLREAVKTLEAKLAELAGAPVPATSPPRGGQHGNTQRETLGTWDVIPPPVRVISRRPPVSPRRKETAAAAVTSPEEQAIYEQALAVAGVLTGNTHHLKVSHPRLLLEILVRLGRITEGEIPRLYPVLRDQILANLEGGPEHDVPLKKIKAAWGKKRAKPWLRIRMNFPTWRGKLPIKVTEAGLVLVEDCLLRHQLDRETILQAQAARRTEKREQRLQPADREETAE